MLTSDSEFSSEQAHQITLAVREALARRRISRQTLAEKAKISLSTLEKALSGRRPFTLATVIRLEEALGTDLRHADYAPAPAAIQGGGTAPEHLGSYTKAAVSWLTGNYLTLRPSFGEAGAVFAYRTEITWSDSASRLIFREAERLDTGFNQQGEVSVPNQSGHVYLVTSISGQYRVAVVGRPMNTGEMYGILTSLRAGRGTQLTPVSAAIALVPIPPGREADLSFGRIGPSHRHYGAYREHLDRVTAEEFALFKPGP
ncbi:helix-turn-helix transcriptional regulator [Labrys neptuniae]|uniref:Helix-turn-helix transcriptional regulator n=1 Tax=Labrys neptuniae TaxID=376174 RepID=A0ABV3PKE8_9HYPH|nr:helix-turn-helix transcriptional regulator [Labrys neptuniae]MDT3376121.1 helix-turn-helix transcriptional regulator [Labrys neptuniae]